MPHGIIIPTSTTHTNRPSADLHFAFDAIRKDTPLITARPTKWRFASFGSTMHATESILMAPMTVHMLMEMKSSDTLGRIVCALFTRMERWRWRDVVSLDIGLMSVPNQTPPLNKCTCNIKWTFGNGRTSFTLVVHKSSILTLPHITPTTTTPTNTIHSTTHTTKHAAFVWNKTSTCV